MEPAVPFNGWKQRAAPSISLRSPTALQIKWTPQRRGPESITVGQRATVDPGACRIEGRAESLDDDGALLRTEHGCLERPTLNTESPKA